jgi:hypothetical protein
MLYVGGESGTTLRPAAAPEETQRARLAEAVVDFKAEPLETAEKLVEAGESVTDRVEHVKQALELVVNGADIAQVIDRLGDWVGEVHRRYGDGDYAGVIRLVRVLTGLLTLALRWRDLVSILALSVAAAQRIGDVTAEAWALRELGSLGVVAGDETLAADLLGRAVDLFEQSGDHGAARLAEQNLRYALTDAAPAPGKVASQSPRERVAGHKAIAGAVAGACAVGVVVFLLLTGGGPDAEIVAFSAASEKKAPGAHDEERGQEVPASAVDPGGVLEACDPLYLFAYVRYSGMAEAVPVLNRATVAGKFDATQSYDWSGPAEFTKAPFAYVYDDQERSASNGEPLPEGLWRFTVTLGGERRAEETVTLRNSCP